LTAAAARALTDEVKSDAAALWTKLLDLYRGGAHLALGYPNWGEYCTAEFGDIEGLPHSSSSGYRLLDAARVVEVIRAHGDGDDAIPTCGNESPGGRTVLPIPTNARVADELAHAAREDPEQVQEVWAEVVHEHGPEPTAAQVRAHVQARRESPHAGGDLDRGAR
jgi:hypothetical protein